MLHKIFPGINIVYTPLMNKFSMMQSNAVWYAGTFVWMKALTIGTEQSIYSATMEKHGITDEAVAMCIDYAQHKVGVYIDDLYEKLK